MTQPDSEPNDTTSAPGTTGANDGVGQAESTMPSYPDQGKTGGKRQKQGTRKGWLWAALAAVVAVALIIAGVFTTRGENIETTNGAEGEVGTRETSISESASPAPSETSAVPSDGNYVDPSGEQTAEIEPAPGQFVGFDGMSLSIDGQTAAVDPIQLTSAGMLIPPTDVTRLGWYSASAVPGARGNSGSTVITGHINYQGQGAGFAAKFTELKLGDEFTIAMDGEPRTYRVTQAPFRVAKGAEMPAVVNDTTGANKVVLITCGGRFVGGTLGYEDNIFTVAEPV